MYAKGSKELQTDGVTADSFEALAEIAIKELLATGIESAGMVCGPITTGGTGHQTNNFEIFNATIEGIANEGFPIFDQTPYEFGLRRLAYQWENAGNSGYCMPILETFYSKVFESGLITKGYFIPGWGSSFGSCWERKKLKKCDAKIVDLTPGNIRQYLKSKFEDNHVAYIMSLLSENT